MTFAILTIDFVHEITIDIWFLVTRFIENIFSYAKTQQYVQHLEVFMHNKLFSLYIFIIGICYFKSLMIINFICYTYYG